MRRRLYFLFLAMAALRPTESAWEALPTLPQEENSAPAVGAEVSVDSAIEAPNSSPDGPVPAPPLECRISGRVRTHDGCAEPGCEVEAFVADEKGDLTKSARKVVSDSAGRFAFTGLAAANTRLVASVEVLESSLVIDLAAESTRTGLEIVLPEEWQPLIRLTDGAGGRLPGASLKLKIDRCPVALDDLGQARPRLSAESHLCWASGRTVDGREFVCGDIVTIEAFAPEVTIALDEWGFADGVVLSPDGTPMPSPALEALVDGYYPLHFIKSGESGFRVELPAGKTATLRAAKPWISGKEEESGRARYFTGTLEDVRAGDRHLVLRTHWVDSDRTLRVRCFAPDGGPLERLSAQAWIGAREENYHEYPDASEVTDSSGACQLTGLADLPTQVGIRLDSGGPPTGWISPDDITVTPNGQEIEFHFRNAAMLGGHAYLPDGSFARSSEITVGTPGNFSAGAYTNDDGRFVIALDTADKSPRTLRASTTLSGVEYEGTLEDVLPGTMGLRLQLFPVIK